MSFTGLETIDSTVQKTNVWLKDLMAEMGTTDRHKAFLALRAVLQVLRERLTVEEVAKFASQLPLLVRGIYYEGWEPGRKHPRERHMEQLLYHVRGYFPNEQDLDAELIVRSVFAVLSKHISEGEINEIRGLFPAELKELWPQAVHSS